MEHLNKSGKYIVIEGNDGTGKSTQAELLSEWLHNEKGVGSYIIEEPKGTDIGEAIRDVVLDAKLERDPETNLLLFTAARHEAWKRAKKELAVGKWVISSRNYLSTICYQGFGEGVDRRVITDLTHSFTDDYYMNPDHTIILTLDHETRYKRIENRTNNSHQDAFESRGDTFQDRVSNSYAILAAQHRYPTIDASQSIEEIHQQIIDIIDE